MAGRGTNRANGLTASAPTSRPVVETPAHGPTTRKPTAEELALLVAKVVETYGGAERLKKVSVIRQFGRVSSRMRGGKVGLMERFFQPPHRLAVGIHFAGEAKEVRKLAGPRSWRNGVEVQGMRRQAMLLQALRMGLPWLFVERSGEVSDLGASELDGRAVRMLGLPAGGSLWIVAAVDPESGRILRSVGSMEVPGAGSFQFESDYGDYRKVDGLLFPFRERLLVRGQETGWVTLEKIELLDQAPPGTFEP